ncbi:MAG: hypothetical protein PHN60_04365, partial [Candidatus Gracilibacteria bacterium]|nr:hypothetical protein [Candidatus Gracilibacteria bacterium]
ASMVKVLDRQEDIIIVKVPATYLPLLRRIERNERKTQLFSDSNIKNKTSFALSLKQKGMTDDFVNNFLKSYE